MSRGRGTRLPLLAAAALVLGGAIGILASTSFRGELRAHRSTPNVPVNPEATNPGNINANNSPTLARNPREPGNLAMANRVDTPAFTCALQVSGDRGSQWSRVRVPIPPGEQPKCYAPDVTFAADGTFYMSYVTLRGAGNRPHAVWIVRSGDGGRTLSEPQRVLGPLAFQVRLTTDPQRPQRLYLTWLQAEEVGLSRFASPGNPINVMRSDDGGRSWGDPVRVSSPERARVLAPAPAVGPDGALYVLYLDVGGDRLDYDGAHRGFGGEPYQGHFSLVLGRSADGGATWAESLVDDRVVPTERFIAFLPPFPSLAVDSRSGRIYASFSDGRLSPSDVHVWSLAPGASRWDGPVRVNDTRARDGTSQYLPKLAVAPGGRLDVIYYDRRDDRANRMNDVSLQSSFDSAETFTPRTKLTDQRFDSRIGAGSERGLPDLGSRLGLVSEASAALAAWTDTRQGTEGSNKQNVAFARAVFSREPQLSSPARNALRYGGIVLLLAGLAWLLSANGMLKRPRDA